MTQTLDQTLEGFHWYKDFINLPTVENPWLIKPIIPVGGWVNIFGQPKKARKSYWAIGAGHAVSNPTVQEWLGFDVPNHGPVLYLQADTPHPAWAKRLRDIASGGYNFNNMMFATIDTLPYPINVEDHYEQLKGYVSMAPTDTAMIIYDTGRQLHRMNENESHSMTILMDMLSDIAGKGRAKMLITHEKKGSEVFDPNQNENDREGGDLMKGNRGSSAVAGAMDTIIKTTPKNMMFYQGRSVGEKHKRLEFVHVHEQVGSASKCPYTQPEDCEGYMWVEDVPPIEAEAKKLVARFPTPAHGSSWQLGRLLARTMEQKYKETCGPDKGRDVIRKLRGER